MLDHKRGKRTTAESQRMMEVGAASPAKLHREVLRVLQPHPKDARRFVTTALWGEADPRTQALRNWRDQWLLKRGWGRAATRLYDRLSPLLINILDRVPWLRAAFDHTLSCMAIRVAKGRD